MAEELLEGTLEYRDDEGVDPRYRALAPSAIAGLLLGVASALAFLHPLLLFVPVSAVGLCAIGLRRTSDPTTGRSGRGAALLGLGLAVLLGGGAAVHYTSHRQRALEEAEMVAQQWFQYLADGQPEKAHQLTLPARSRFPIDGSLWDVYRTTEGLPKKLREFVADYGRGRCWLGKDARIRPYAVENQYVSRKFDLVEKVYAVTFESDGHKKSFFIKVDLARTTDPVTGVSSWNVSGNTCPYLPEAWPDPAMQRAARKRR